MNNNRSSELKKYYSAIYKRYDLVNRLFTLGQDQYWRRVAVRKCLSDNPSKVLDLCCGTGDLTICLGKYKNTETQIIGYDFNPEMLEYARKKTVNRKYSNIEFLEGDAGKMPFSDNNFDAITIGFGFRNLTYDNPDCEKNIHEIVRVLKPGGYFYILESGVPKSGIIRFFYKIYLYLFLIPIGSIISGNFKAYSYLAKSSSNFYTNDELKELLLQNKLEFRYMKKFFFGAADLFLFRKQQLE